MSFYFLFVHFLGSVFSFVNRVISGVLVTLDEESNVSASGFRLTDILRKIDRITEQKIVFQ